MKKIDSITITKQRSYVLILQAMLLFLLGGAIFSGVTNTNDFMSAGFSGIIVYILTIVVHELLHGLGFMLSGVRPKYGVAMAGVVPVAYATSEEKVSVPGMLMTAYLPFVALSVIFLIFARAYPQYQALAMVGFIGNFTGAVGDLWIASKLWKYLPFGDVLVMDTKAGLKIYSDSPDAAARGAKAMKKSHKSDSFGRNWAIAAIVVLAFQLLTPAVIRLLGFNGSYALGYDPVYLFELTAVQNNVVGGASFNLALPFALGLLYALVAQVIKFARSKS